MLAPARSRPLANLRLADARADSSDDGKATDFHLVHHGAMALRGWGNLMVEATGVVPEGRISPQDMGIWSDAHVGPLKRVVDFVHAQGAKIGIQLAHAGRKASTNAPWVQRLAVERGWKGGEVAPAPVGGWPEGVYGPSAIAYNAENPDPIAASVEYIQGIVKAFGDAAQRAKDAGFDYIEIHGAHGYWNHNFCDPVSNARTDQYGGSFDNRVRMSLEVVAEVRRRWDGPLLYRVSATDWLEGTGVGPEKLPAPHGKEEWAYWGIEQTVLLAQRLRDTGVDLLDVSSGGNDERGQIDVRPGYQVPYAERIKRDVPGLLVGAVGLITEAKQAEDILATGQADVVLFGREVLRDVDFPLHAALELGVAAAPAVQYERAHSRLLKHAEPVTAVPRR